MTEPGSDRSRAILLIVTTAVIGVVVTAAGDGRFVYAAALICGLAWSRSGG